MFLLKMVTRVGGLLLAASLLGGCATELDLLTQDKKWEASLPPEMPTAATANGAIYQAGQDIRLFENSVARRVGDTLTIRLAETTDAQKSSSTETKKGSTISVPEPSIAGRKIPFRASTWGATDVSSDNSFTGEGSSKQSNSITGEITVTVAKRWPNGNLLVRGEKWITINQGREFVRLSGIVRAADINPDNTVLSTRVADARISYASRGALADANAPGLLSRFFNLPWLPL